jgi:Tol biopolymer transport system component
MPLAPGTRIGAYEVAAPLGAGGMGEVYRARDTRLGRDVAIKVLPPAFADDPERLARFEREARLLASLSHPNIATIHAVEEYSGGRVLVMELVEGETLAARLGRGAVPVDEAIEIAGQVAAGVEAAHETGVIHRDLKPGNIMVRPEGTVKVLDFGLARGPEQSGSASDLSRSPTITTPATMMGVILGTAAYMSPEQAKGRAVDRRADIWAFGVVLFEMLTGRRLFEGETVSETIAGVMKDEVPWSALPAGVPRRLRTLLERCLTRDVRQRLQSMGEARIALERAREPEAADATASVTARPAWRAWLPWALLAAVSAIALGRGLLTGGAAGTSAAPERRFELAFPAGQHRTLYAPALSPDGRWLAVVGSDSTGTTRLWLRAVAQFEFRPVKGTEGAAAPFWSPDSRSLGFVANGQLQRYDVQSGAVEVIANGVETARGASWGRDGTILYTPNSNAGIWRVPATGGTPTPLTRPDSTIVDGSHRFPVWLPDGQHFLFAFWSNNARELEAHGGIYLASVRGGEVRQVSRDAGSFLVLPSGHLVVRRGKSLVALPFDLRSFRLGAEATLLSELVNMDGSSGLVRATASMAGDFVFDGAPELGAQDEVWLDRDGRNPESMGLDRGLLEASLSPDGSRILGTADVASGLSEVWIADLARRTTSRLTRSQNDCWSPRWSPDGQQIAFANDDSGTNDIYIAAASGTRPRQLVWRAQRLDTEYLEWSHDGRALLMSGPPRPGRTHSRLWMVGLQGDSARTLLADEYNMTAPRLSPDGRWLAYVSDESGHDELYVRTFPALDRKWQISTTGAGPAHWRRDGRELVYFGGPGARTAFAVALTPTPAGPSFGDPRALFTLKPDQIEASPDPDHRRFMALVRPAAMNEPPMRVVLGWHGAPAR